MTEYKKLCTLVEQLRSMGVSITRAFENGDGSDAVALHSWSTSIETLISNIRPRILKILHKALETDPNRQIYNETMCGAIKHLFEDFCDIVSGIFEQSVSELLLLDDGLIFKDSPSLKWASSIYDQHLILLAETEAWEKRLASNILELVLFEEESRAVHSAVERKNRNDLSQMEKVNKTWIRELLRREEVLRWETEMRRRIHEHRQLTEKRRLYSPEDVGVVLLDLPLSLRKNLAENILQLVRALQRTPEDPNICRIRCNNLRVITEYGHSALSSECQTCQMSISSAEFLWYMLGYHVEYSSSPVHSLRDVIERSPPIRLPCGRYASEHQITQIGFEEHSERFFRLCEPNPIQESSEWMSWYATVQSVEHSIKDCLA